MLQQCWDMASVEENWHTFGDSDIATEKDHWRSLNRALCLYLQVLSDSGTARTPPQKWPEEREETAFSSLSVSLDPKPKRSALCSQHFEYCLSFFTRATACLRLNTGVIISPKMSPGHYSPVNNVAPDTYNSLVNIILGQFHRWIMPPPSPLSPGVGLPTPSLKMCVWEIPQLHLLFPYSVTRQFALSNTATVKTKLLF